MPQYWSLSFPISHADSTPRLQEDNNTCSRKNLKRSARFQYVRVGIAQRFIDFSRFVQPVGERTCLWPKMADEPCRLTLTWLLNYRLSWTRRAVSITLVLLILCACSVELRRAIKLQISQPRRLWRGCLHSCSAVYQYFCSATLAYTGWVYWL